MHIDHQGTDTYMTNNIELPDVQVHNDLEVIINQDFKTTIHCIATAAKSFRTLWSMGRFKQTIMNEFKLHPIAQARTQ